MFVRTLQFRAEVIVYSFLDVLPFFVIFFVWQALFQQVDTINNFSLSQIVNYYLLVIIIDRLSATHFEGWRSEEIRNGKIDYFLTRPFSYISELLSKDVGSKIISIFFSMPVVITFYLINVYAYKIDQNYFTLANLLLFFGLMIVAYAIQFMIALWIVLLTFWFEGSSGLEHFKWIVLTLFSGAMIPIEFMPLWLKNITNLLPLKYIYAIPIGVIQGTTLLTINDYFTIIITLAVMFVFSKFLWGKAKYQYTSVGG